MTLPEQNLENVAVFFDENDFDAGSRLMRRLFSYSALRTQRAERVVVLLLSLYKYPEA